LLLLLEGSDFEGLDEDEPVDLTTSGEAKQAQANRSINIVPEELRNMLHDGCLERCGVSNITWLGDDANIFIADSSGRSLSGVPVLKGDDANIIVSRIRVTHHTDLYH
jgi:hypothetical protein